MRWHESNWKRPAGCSARIRSAGWSGRATLRPVERRTAGDGIGVCDEIRLQKARVGSEPVARTFGKWCQRVRLEAEALVEWSNTWKASWDYKRRRSGKRANQEEASIPKTTLRLKRNESVRLQRGFTGRYRAALGSCVLCSSRLVGFLKVIFVKLVAKGADTNGKHFRCMGAVSFAPSEGSENVLLLDFAKI